MTTWRARVAFAVAALSAWGCSSPVRQADRAFDAGNWSLAAALYTQEKGALAEESRLRLALARALDASSAAARGEVREALQAIAQRHRGGWMGAQAQLFLRLLDQVDDAKARLDEVTAEAAGLASRVHALEADAKARAAELERARVALGDAEERQRRLQTQLEELKKIDTQVRR
jgi:predicted nuclease with TOPRIM domain